MRILVLGGIRSGKSQWAETAVAAAAGPDAEVCYLATGAPADTDAAWAARVDAHRRRRPAQWSTVETSDLATALTALTGTAALVDDIGGWLTSVMDRRDAWAGTSIDADVDALVTAVSGFSSDLVLVSPEVGLTVVPATESGRLFADELGAVNQHLAAACDRVVLVVAGQPVMVKEPK